MNLRQLDLKFHPSIILVKMAEAAKKSKNPLNLADLQTAVTSLSDVYEDMVANKVDAKELGDVCDWIGRACVMLMQEEKAKQYFQKSITHYVNQYESIVPDVNQVPAIKDVMDRLRMTEPNTALSLTRSLGHFGEAAVGTPSVQPVVKQRKKKNFFMQ